MGPIGYNRRRSGIVNAPKLAAYMRRESSDNVEIGQHNGPLCGIDAAGRAVVRANASCTGWFLHIPRTNLAAHRISSRNVAGPV